MINFKNNICGMKPLLSYVLCGCLLLSRIVQAQTITYSAPEKKDFDRFKFEVIAKRDNMLLVYKALYFGNPYTPAPANASVAAQVFKDYRRMTAGSPMLLPPDRTVLGSSICVYDSGMHLLAEKVLPIPKKVSGVRYLVFDNFFYLFYQYVDGHTLRCMAVKVGMDGGIQGEPVELGNTYITDNLRTGEVYSIVHSEDKQYFTLFSVNVFQPPYSVVTSILFDKDLHRIRQCIHTIAMSGSEYLSEFRMDNKGNFLFVAQGDPSLAAEGHQAVLFLLPRNSDSMSSVYIAPPPFCLDDIRLLIDNEHERYIIASFYSMTGGRPVRGIFTLVRDARDQIPDVVRQTVLPEKKGLDDYYLQDLHIGKGGDFIIEAQQLALTPDLPPYTRWDYALTYSDLAFKEYAHFDPNESYQYFPWSQWRMLAKGFQYSSRGALIARFDTTGAIQWTSTINLPQVAWVPFTIGYKSVIANDLLYFLYNTRIRQKVYLTAQSIDADGHLNTGGLKEEMALKDQSDDYVYFPRQAREVDAGEIIMPCRKGHLVCLARVRF